MKINRLNISLKFVFKMSEKFINLMKYDHLLDTTN
jgi:hypothetical protein